MYLHDQVERMEECAECAFDKMDQGGGKMKCGCGTIFDLDDGIFISPNPYAMPVCGNCAAQYFETLTEKKACKE